MQQVLWWHTYFEDILRGAANGNTKTDTKEDNVTDADFEEVK